MTNNVKNIDATTRGIEASAHETGLCEPQNLLELDMLYQQAQQQLRAEGAEAFGRMKRQRTEANDVRRREVSRLRRELAGLGTSYYNVSGRENPSFHSQLKDNFSQYVGLSLILRLSLTFPSLPGFF